MTLLVATNSISGGRALVVTVSISSDNWGISDIPTGLVDPDLVHLDLSSVGITF